MITKQHDARHLTWRQAQLYSTLPYSTGTHSAEHICRLNNYIYMVGKLMVRNGRVVRWRTCDREGVGSNPNTNSAWGWLMSRSLQAMGWRPSAADWGVWLVCLSCCTAGPLVHYRDHWLAAYHAAVPLAHANQLTLPRLSSAAVHESSHVNINIIIISRHAPSVRSSACCQ